MKKKNMLSEQHRYSEREREAKDVSVFLLYIAWNRKWQHKTPHWEEAERAAAVAAGAGVRE